ncbi:hypothetical protein BDZ97DRAFT_2015705 [Flammula alnicola]|nr:hypothetical protein BDZ97DRAFT_2015705 [Flammula alnicola]
MASEHPSSNVQPNRPPSPNTHEDGPGTSLHPAPRTPGQESGDPFRSREGSVGRDAVPQIRTEDEDQPSRTNPVYSSDQERGLRGPGDNSDRQELIQNNQGLGAGQPLPAPVLRNRPLSGYEDRPRSNNSHPSREWDPFAGSPHGSPSGRYTQINTGTGNLQPSTSQNQSPSSLNRPGEHGNFGRPGLPRDDNHGTGDEGLGARLLHVAEDYIHDNLGSHDPRLPSFPARLLHAAEDIGTGIGGGIRRHRAIDTRAPRAPHSVIDHIVPVEVVDEKDRYPFGSIGSRLSATLKDARKERDKYAAKAKMTGYALNIAIGLQVLLGSLTTGLSAVATRGKSAATQTTILGALSTLVASYLARARGSNEPELSITRVKDLDKFIRECENFITDHGDDMSHDYDKELEHYRMQFEELLGNANGERRLSPVGMGK